VSSLVFSSFLSVFRDFKGSFLLLQPFFTAALRKYNRLFRSFLFDLLFRVFSSNCNIPLPPLSLYSETLNIAIRDPKALAIPRRWYEDSSPIGPFSFSNFTSGGFTQLPGAMPPYGGGASNQQQQGVGVAPASAAAGYAQVAAQVRQSPLLRFA
jgi:hypothetical protein